jgi:3-phosphoshikimate 1-carboxyvinyltransferase
MDFLDLAPATSASGTVKLPGSKSISNRTLLLAALAEGATEVTDLLDADDTRVMRAALAKLGVRIDALVGRDCFRVHGLAGAPFPVRVADLSLGNAGTAIRPLTAALAVLGGHYRLSGVPRMHERPIGDLVDALRGWGATIGYEGSAGYPPLTIGALADGGDVVRVKGDVSSQFLSALLLAAPLRQRDSVIEVEGELISKPYVELTLGLMGRFGVEVAREGWLRFRIPAAARYRSPGAIAVEGDASSASYFLAAGAIGGGPVRVTGVGALSVQGDVRFAEALEKMGATIRRGDNWIEAARGDRLVALDADMNHIPDAAMTLATTALFAKGTTTLRNIASWRVKETDRLAAMATELAKLGATVEQGADFIRITPPAQIRPATIDTYDDHRMAMSFALASFGGVAIRINDPKCVDKTFPRFFDEWRALVK